MSDAASPALLPEVGSRAHDLLTQVVEVFRERGTVDISLRDLAASVGTSHRMLTYHLGTRENVHGLAMLELSRQYLQHFEGKRPASRADVVRAAWTRFREPSNRLQTQLLFSLSAAAAAHPDLDNAALAYDLDNFANALTAFGTAEGLAPDVARREARLIVATLLGLYLDFYVTRGSTTADDSFQALIEWIERSSREARG
ncbi:hypothetical protein BH10ACT7_BH10ACT7_08660 [soil metagenome]